MQASDYLKENTARYHDAAEAKFQSKKIFDGTFTMEDYRQLLMGNYLLTRRLEPLAMEVLQPEFGATLDLESRRKLPALEKDLQALGEVLPPDTNADLPQLSVPMAFGVLYVMEGSTLGGSVMARQLAKNPQLADKEFNYLGIYGSDLGNRWKTFQTVMNGALKEEDFPDALHGAELAYRVLLGI